MRRIKIDWLSVGIGALALFVLMLIPKISDVLISVVSKIRSKFSKK